MNNAILLFREFLQKRAKPMLTRHSFIRRGALFTRVVGQNQAMVWFQRARASSSEWVRFTVNVGVFNYLLFQFIYQRSDDADPKRYGWHWEERAALLLPTREDCWWTLPETESPDPAHPTIDEMTTILDETIVPFVVDLATEDHLYDFFLHGYTGRGDLLRLMYVSIFALYRRDIGFLKEVVQDLKQRGVACIHIKMLRDKMIEMGLDPNAIE